MDIYYTIEEKYLQAIDELNYGESPRALQLLNEIISKEPDYARAHYQLGLLYYYTIEDYQSAGYHFKLCTEFDATYPDVYHHYLKLIIFLEMEKLVVDVAEKALKTAGVSHTAINDLLGLHAEKGKRWEVAIDYYRKALLNATTKKESDNLETNIDRVKTKKSLVKKYNYQLSS